MANSFRGISKFANLFSEISFSTNYSKFRPSPPNDLVWKVLKFLEAKIKPPFSKAVDIGCGTGQSTFAFAPHFQSIVGLDASEAQIENAIKDRSAANVAYRLSNAEDTGIQDTSLQLVIAGQAVHWFDINKFFDEAKRILVHNGVLAVYKYTVPMPIFDSEEKTQAIQNIISSDLYAHSAKYADERLKIWGNSYSGINFPFGDLTRENIDMRTTISLSEFISLLTCTSQYQLFREENPMKAKTLAHDLRTRISDILAPNADLNDIIVPITTRYHLILGRNTIN